VSFCEIRRLEDFPSEIKIRRRTKCQSKQQNITLKLPNITSNAARHHKEAAKHHEAGNHEKAAHHAHVAHGHHLQALHHDEEATKFHLEHHGKK